MSDGVENPDRAEPRWTASQPTPEMAEAMRAGVEKAIETAGPDFGAALRELEQAVAHVSRFDLINFNSLYFLTTFEGSNPEFDSSEGIFQHHVELIQSVALRSDVANPAPDTPLHVGIQPIVVAVKSVFESFMVLEAAHVSQAKDPLSRRRQSALAEIRTHTAVVRGRAYHSDFSEVLADLFKPIDDDIETSIGLRATSLVQWWWAVTAEVEKRIADHREFVSDLFEMPFDDSWAGEIKNHFSRLPLELSPDLIEMLGKNDEQRRAYITFASDLELGRIFAFTLDELVDCYPGDVDPDDLAKALRSWSLGFGETGDQSVQEMVLNNPVTAQPLVHLNDTLYLWADASAFNESAFRMLEQLIENDDALWAKYLDRRAEFLEGRVPRELKTKFPTSRILENVFWTDPKDGREYESDCIVLLDSTALVVESKGGRMSPQSGAGKGRPLRGDIDDLIVAPSKQARRLAEYLQGKASKAEFRSKEGETTHVDTSGLVHVATVGVTLETLASMLPRLADLVESGLAEEEIKSLSYNLNLFDLMTVLSILGHRSEVIHYFSRREELEHREFVSGEETDMLGFYLETGFNLGSAEFEGGETIQLFGLSDPIDRYFYGLEQGLDVARPTVRRTKWWEELLSLLERKAFPRWTEVGVGLCRVAYEEQLEFAAALATLRDQIRSGARPATDFIFFANGPEERRDYFVGLIATEEGTTEREDQIAAIASQVFAKEVAVQRLIVLGMHETNTSMPYRTFGVFDRPTD